MKRASFLIACGLFAGLAGCGRTDLLSEEELGVSDEAGSKPDTGAGPGPDSSTIFDSGARRDVSVPDAV
ncbi:MAG: hypothetical protein JOZ69_21515, partial [Myxococcales bacterium]|nr:hypothetical protein [Myxococcales bacterium]